VEHIEGSWLVQMPACTFPSLVMYPQRLLEATTGVSREELSPILQGIG